MSTAGYLQNIFSVKIYKTCPVQEIYLSYIPQEVSVQCPPQEINLRSSAVSLHRMSKKAKANYPVHTLRSKSFRTDFFQRSKTHKEYRYIFFNSK
jgi:hypothetical protein